MADKRARIDWDSIEPHYRAGVRSLRDIADEFKVSNVAIVKHAEKAGWTRNLAAKIQEKADAKVAAALVAAERADSPAGKLTEAVRVEVEAEVQSRIRIKHQKTLGKLDAISERLIADLSSSGEEFKIQVASLKTLYDTAKTLIALERQAYGVDKLLDISPGADEVDPIEGAKRLAFVLARAGHQLQQGK
jgi:hypothetical protein